MMRSFSWLDVLHLVEAARWTLLLALIAFIGGGVMGAAVTLMRISRSAALRAAAIAYVEVLQGTPLLMQLFLWFFMLTLLLPIKLSALAVAAIALTLNASSFFAEIWRGSIEVTRDLGRSFALDDVAFKPAPACFFAQMPAQVAAAVGPVPAIERIDVRVSQTAADFPGCASRETPTAQAAVMSIPFAVASTLLAGRIEPRAWADFADPAIAALASRCTVLADPAITARTPARSGAALSIHCADGRTIEREQDDFVSMHHDDVVDRLRDAAGPDVTSHLLALTDALETLDEAGALARACARSPESRSAG